LEGQLAANFDAEPEAPDRMRLASPHKEVRPVSGLIPLEGRLLLPFQFPSLLHLDRCVDEVIARTTAVEGLSPVTGDWARGGYRCFRRFIVVERAEGRFLSGDHSAQVTVLEDWVAWMRARHTQRSTINSYWRALVLLGTRIQRRTGFVNVFRALPAPHPGHARLKCLTREQATTVLAWVVQVDWQSAFVAARNVALLGTMVLAGLRRSEAIGLAFADVDLPTRLIQVRAGKGRNGGKPRAIPMTDQLLTFLSRYVEERRRRGSNATTFFLASRKDAPLTATIVKRLFRSIEAGTQIHVSPHMLRHTFCTLLSQSGISDRLAMQAMGHADLRMLQRYQHVYAGEVAQEIQKLRLDVPM
jgi:site-specific recombinase XerD